MEAVFFYNEFWIGASGSDVKGACGVEIGCFERVDVAFWLSLQELLEVLRWSMGQK